MDKTNRGRGGQPGNQNARKQDQLTRLNNIYKALEEREIDRAMKIQIEIKFKNE